MTRQTGDRRRGSAHQNPSPKYLSVELAETQLGVADLFLYRRARGSVFSAVIAAAGATLWTHAALAVPVCGEWCVGEVVEWYGGRLTTLATQVARYPGRVDWFESNAFDRFAHFDRRGAAREMVRLAGRPYGWREIVSLSRLHLPVVRLFTTPDTDDRESPRDLVCSSAVSWCLRTGGKVEVVPNLADRETEPHHLANASFFRYRGTLMPAGFATEKQKAGTLIPTNQR